MAEDIIYGWKMLNPAMCTEYEGKYYAYPAPKPGEKWSEWFDHPAPATPNGSECGPGRWHIMVTKGPDASYAPRNWHPWFVQGRGLIGKTSDKAGVTSIRLRRVTPKVFWRIIRFGWCCGANLRDADLRDADLRDANLRWADLSGADLRGADLRDADLRDADLSYADLRGADLRGADLRGANLRWANLSEANLRWANLSEANLRWANLRWANLSGANLDNIIKDYYTIGL